MKYLALSSLPDFDPNEPGQATKDGLFNRVTLGVYEMGSTFKTFSTAMALDTQKVTMTSQFDATTPIVHGQLHDLGFSSREPDTDGARDFRAFVEHRHG